MPCLEVAKEGPCALVCESHDPVDRYRLHSRAKPGYMLRDPPDVPGGLGHTSHAGVKVFLVKIVVRLALSKLSRDIPGERAGCGAQVNACSNEGRDPAAELVYIPADQLLPSGHLCFGKEGAQREAAGPMDIMI